MNGILISMIYFNFLKYDYWEFSRMEEGELSSFARNHKTSSLSLFLFSLLLPAPVRLNTICKKSSAL